MSAVFDPGLQPERTELAWRRTVLALAAGSLLSLRILPDALDNVAWIAPGIVGLLLCAWIWISARHRYERLNSALLNGADLTAAPDGLVLLTTALFTSLIGFLGAVLVLTIALRPA